ncbi:MAG: transposase [Pirellulaceae bacterium]
MSGQAMSLDDSQRVIIQDVIRAVAEHRSWKIDALAVRTNHVHVIVEADATPEKVMNDFKSWCTRRLREYGMVTANEPIWSRHGSTRFLWNDDAVARAIEYVVEGQGDWVT